MTETISAKDSRTLPLGRDHRCLRAGLPVRRIALGVATGLVLAVPLLAACKGGTTENVDKLNGDIVNVDEHLYIKGPDGKKFEISIGKDANGKDVVVATRVDQ